MPVVLINPESGLAESFDPKDVSGALTGGYHLPLVSPEGDAVSASAAEAPELLKGGHAHPNTEQLKDLVDYAKYNSLGERAKSVGEGALESFTGGLSGLAGGEESRKRAEYNPGSHAIGEAAGIGAGLFLAPEVSAPGLISKIGTSAATKVGGKGLVGTATKMATQGAVEGGLLGGTHVLNERLMGDPNATAEHMLGEIGINAALGGGLSLALSPLTHVLAGGKELRSMLPEKASSGSLTDVLSSSGLKEGERESVIDGLGRVKKNATEIKEAADLIGAPLPESMVSDSKFIQDLDSTLAKTPTTIGINRQQMFSKGYEAANNAVDQALGTASDLTKAQVGNELKQGLSERFKLEQEPISELFEKIRTGVAAEKEAGSGVKYQFGYQDIPVSEDGIKQVAKDVMGIEGVKVSPSSPQFRLARTVSKEIGNLKTLDDIKQYRSNLSDQIKGDPSLRFVGGEIQKKLAEVEEKSIIKMAKDTAPEDSPLHQEIKNLITERKRANGEYGKLIDKIKDVGSIVGKKLRRGEGPKAFLDWLSDAPPEQIASRLFTKNNSEFLASFEKEFPQQADILKTYQKNQIRQAAIKDGKVSAAKVLSSVDKLEPEIQKFLFKPEELQRIQAADIYISAIPKEVNPSGTAQTLNLIEWLKHPMSLPIAHAADYAKLEFIKRAVGKLAPGEASLVNTLIHVKELALKTAKAIDKSASQIFSRAAGTMMEDHPKKREPRTPSDEMPELKLNRIGTMVLNQSANPESLNSHLSQGLTTISQHAPETATAFSSGVARAVTFLASKVPNQGKMSPLDAHVTPSNVEVAKFNRYAHVVDKPLSVLTHIREATILPQDIEALSVVYPQLYSQMKSTLFNKMTDALSKKDTMLPYRTKMGLSMFLGQNLESTLLPQAIMSTQKALQPLMGPAAQNTKPSKVGMGKFHVENDATQGQIAATRRAKTNA